MSLAYTARDPKGRVVQSGYEERPLDDQKATWLRGVVGMRAGERRRVKAPIRLFQDGQVFPQGDQKDTVVYDIELVGLR